MHGDAPSFLDINGDIVVLPYDGIVNIARFICQNNIRQLRCFSIDRVYKRNPAGGQPRQTIGADFCILGKSTSALSSSSQCLSLIDQAEIIKIALECVEEALTQAKKTIDIAVRVRLIDMHLHF